MSQLVACPECKKHLQVPDELLGKKVQCPECKHTFTAQSPDDEPAPSSPGTGISKRPSSKSGRDKPDDDDDDRPSRSKRRDSGYDVRDRDDDDDDDERPRPSRRRRSSHYASHRGGMILAFGLIGLILGFTGLFFPVIFAILAWVMGNNDMEEMRAGRMDPEGEGMTQAGRIMGIIGVILHIVYVLVICGFFAIWFLCFGMLVAGGAAGAANNPNNINQPRRKF